MTLAGCMQPANVISLSSVAYRQCKCFVSAQIALKGKRLQALYRESTGINRYLNRGNIATLLLYQQRIGAMACNILHSMRYIP